MISQNSSSPPTLENDEPNPPLSEVEGEHMVSQVGLLVMAALEQLII